MLTITDTAAEAVRQLASGSGLEEEGAGVRISAGAPTSGGTPLQVELATGPQAADQTVEEAGATVYVEPQVAEYLDDKVLDAEVAGTQVRFTLLERPA